MDASEDSIEWPKRVYDTLKTAGVTHASYVPDAGHATLIDLFNNDPDVISNVLSTEEEGVAIAVGSWLGGTRSVILMQSSGVGNCINMLSLPVQTRTPLVMLVTMRGEWGEFNPWQVPMGRATPTVLEAIGLRVMRADTAEDAVDAVAAAVRMAYDGDQQVAVLLSQRLLGSKTW